MAKPRAKKACEACGGKRWLIVAVDGNDAKLRIERCDACSADVLTDADVQRDPEAREALSKARVKAKLEWNPPKRPASNR
jgi:hypothetical protein